MAESHLRITEIVGEYRGQPCRIEVDGWGNCTMHAASTQDLGIVNPFALRLVMEGVTIAAEKAPEDRLLRCEQCGGHHIANYACAVPSPENGGDDA